MEAIHAQATALMPKIGGPKSDPIHATKRVIIPQAIPALLTNRWDLALQSPSHSSKPLPTATN
ncbi:hypothetical protein ABIB00_007691 [Bradyrhizobium sp. LB14.3]